VAQGFQSPGYEATNQKVVGSNPAGLTIKETSKEASFSLCFKDCGDSL